MLKPFRLLCSSVILKNKEFQMNIASYIDHTILKPTTILQDVETLCSEAAEYGFAAVCVPPYYVHDAAGFLKGKSPKVATVIGFPFGYSSISAKVAETKQAVSDGADEIDMVINIAALKNGDYATLEKEIAAVMEAKPKETIIKIIIESGILTNEEIVKCCSIYAAAGVDFMKTSTGYAEKGASAEAVQLMRQHLPSSIKIKASGGIRNYSFAKELVLAGAERLGCSAGVAIVKGEEQIAPGTY
jgi:deoxyribose-phosphate aldolase